MSQFQTTAEVAITLGVSRRTVLNLIARGDLRATRVGRQWRIPVSELQRMENGGRRNGSSKGAPRGVRKEPSNIVPIGPVRHALIPFTEVTVLPVNGTVAPPPRGQTRDDNPAPANGDSGWLTVTQAAKRLMDEDVIDGLDLSRAKTRVSSAATRGHLVTNCKSSTRRRIDSGSLANWILDLRRKSFAKDIDMVKPKRKRQPMR